MSTRAYANYKHVTRIMHDQTLGTIGIILGTVVALWLATIIAACMSYRIVALKILVE